jgi:hypothetical protein
MNFFAAIIQFRRIFRHLVRILKRLMPPAIFVSVWAVQLAGRHVFDFDPFQTFKPTLRDVACVLIRESSLQFQTTRHVITRATSRANPQKISHNGTFAKKKPPGQNSTGKNCSFTMNSRLLISIFLSCSDANCN